MLLSMEDLVLKILRIPIPVLPRIRKETDLIARIARFLDILWIVATRSMDILLDINLDCTTILMLLLIKFLLLMKDQISLILLEVLFKI